MSKKWVEPICPECGAKALYVYYERHELVMWAVTRVYDTFALSGYEMGPAPESEGGYDELEEAPDFTGARCNACGTEFPSDAVVYDQAPHDALAADA